jgi:hypothetical protein
MTKRGMKDALSASLKDETKAVKDRFERAERVLGAKPKMSTPPPAAKDDPRVIRDSFTMPEADYRLIDPLKKRCMRAGVGVNKSELLRVGLHALTKMSDRELAQLVGDLPRVKPGRRPKRGAADSSADGN